MKENLAVFKTKAQLQKDYIEKIKNDYVLATELVTYNTKFISQNNNKMAKLSIAPDLLWAVIDDLINVIKNKKNNLL